MNKRKWVNGALVGAVCISMAGFRAAAQSNKDAVKEAESVSLVRLLAFPEKYQDKRVRVVGFARLAYEHNALYLHKEDYEQSIYNNGVWVSLPATFSQQDERQLSMRYCVIEATFDARSKGHLGLWSGSLKNVTLFESWSDPAKPKR